MVRASGAAIYDPAGLELSRTSIRLGRNGRELKAIRVTLSESHVARAQFEAPLW